VSTIGAKEHKKNGSLFIGRYKHKYTVAKLSKDSPVDGKVLERLCASLKC